MDNEPVLCPSCGHQLAVGEYPFCKGREDDHITRRARPHNGIFPFTLPHIDGKPMEITSIDHLRKVERQYGVVLSAFSKESINDLTPIKDLPRFNEKARRRN